MDVDEGKEAVCGCGGWRAGRRESPNLTNHVFSSVTHRASEDWLRNDHSTSSISVRVAHAERTRLTSSPRRSCA